MIILIQLVMELAPFGVAALVAEVIGLSGLSVLQALLAYGLTVVLGLAIHAGLVYGGLVHSLAKISWLTFMRAIRQAQLIAFSTSSSSATLPVSIQCAEQRLGVSSPSGQFCPAARLDRQHGRHGPVPGGGGRLYRPGVSARPVPIRPADYCADRHHGVYRSSWGAWSGHRYSGPGAHHPGCADGRDRPHSRYRPAAGYVSDGG